jgi:Family of unknown function (DUF6335)
MPTRKSTKAKTTKKTAVKQKAVKNTRKLASAKKSSSKKNKTVSSKKAASKSKKFARKAGRKPPTKRARETGSPGSGFIDAGRLETEIYEPDPEVKEEFAEAAVLGDPSRRVLLDEIRENAPAESPVLSGGDIDAAWDQADASGEETVGGSNPTPDQDIVEELGKAVGLTYQDNEPLDTTEKVDERDRHRWELDPGSSEDFNERNKRPKNQE